MDTLSRIVFSIGVGLAVMGVLILVELIRERNRDR